MSANPKTFHYLKAAAETLVDRGTFRNDQSFRPTQGDALHAYHSFLNSNELTQEQKLKGFFEIPTGVGKTALFLAILDEAHRIARAENDKLRAMIVVPTIAILEQMKGTDEKKGEIEEWAPDYLKTVGYYGGDSRDIGEELTIITYNSWDKLMGEGAIDSSNIDILISDEAHRGTSDRRLTNQFNSFASGTAQLAFTATARFDADKSVEQSHGHQIFSRGVGESIRLGELAAYIQTQLYVIRVQPQPDTEEPRDDAATRAGKKQEAWMRQMVAVMRDGRDEHTGDLLTDNKSGIYVQGTDMADRFVQLACADPALQQRAREKGCKEVVVAVHSKMHPMMQKARLAAFARGEYLGLVSDEKLKEGFNDPPMKNVFDYQRGSLVDKAQIVGRPARQWFTPEKNRYEGATIIDTIIYIGSNDSKEDERLKAEAIRNAVMAWSILEGPAVFDPKEEWPPRTGVGGGGVAPVLGLDVESYLDLEDIRAIYAEQKILQGENRIDITDEMREELNAQMERKGVGSMVLIKAGGLDGVVTVNVIESWRRGSKSAERSVWERVTGALELLADAGLAGKIDITDEMREELNRQMERKGVGVMTLIKAGGLDDVVTVSVIEHWRSGGAKSAERSVWERVTGALELLADAGSADKIDITDEMREGLNKLMERKGVGSTALIKAGGLDDVVKMGVIESWRSRKAKSAERSVWERVTGALELLADAGPADKIDITDEMREGLNRQMERKGGGARALIKAGGLDDVVKVSTINSWKSGGAKSAERSVWERVTGALELLADAGSADKIDITDEMREGLNKLMERKGVGSTALIKAGGLDDVVKMGVIESWRSRKAKSAERSVWERVTGALELLADAGLAGKIDITDEMREDLNRQMARKGVGARMLIKAGGLDDVVTAGVIEGWGSGRSKRAKQSVWERVTGALELLADAGPADKIDITDEMRDDLSRQMARKGVWSTALIKAGGLDGVVTVSVIEGWRSGHSKSAERSVWERVTGALEGLPDKRLKGPVPSF